MSKVIIYHLDAPGLAKNYAAVDRFLETEIPDNWYEMSDEEQDEYAREQFYQQFSWGWQVVDA
ncbi:hypothetical protein [Eikenella halliae]|uniref:Uncharacterized protein n=1 Tax=Eikenella halliae TaxID=1795832 RepID=A0A1B6W0Q1_9NEIS|nr:hypothetical protein [Eikenella halliae]OAM44213.1 hypothetical protein A7Q00_03055 [Eikenella halliae]